MSNIKSLQLAVNQARANGASDAEVEFIMNNFKNNMVARQNDFKNQFSSYAESFPGVAYQRKITKLHEEGMETVETGLEEEEYLKNYHLNNAIPMVEVKPGEQYWDSLDPSHPGYYVPIVDLSLIHI